MTKGQFTELVGIAIGEASMCWDEIPKGIFDSTRASSLVDRIVDALYRPGDASTERAAEDK